MVITPENIYRKVLKYCNDYGLIRKLEDSFSFPEEKLFNKLNISEKGLDILDAVHCVYDKKRTLFFLRELDSVLEDDHVVMEAGIGTGVLSFFASTKSSQVYGFEINPSIYNLAQKIKNHLLDKKILLSEPNFLLKDATKYKTLKSVDVLISENIYTGMFFEKQVQIVNNLLPFLKDDGLVIPHKLESFFILSETILPKNVKNKDVFIPSKERKIRFRTKTLSNPKSYDLLNFKNKSPLSVKKEMFIMASRDGEINSLIIYNEVIMPSGLVIKRDDTTFLNNDMIIAVQPSLKVKNGDIINVSISYKYGSNPKDAKIYIKKK